MTGVQTCALPISGGIKLTTADQSQGKQYRIVGSDYDYLAAYDLKLVAGRKFSKDYGNDPHSVVLSKKAAEQMGFTRPEDALGKQVDFWGQAYAIVGVVDNFHQQSLRDAYDAIIFRCIPDIRGYVSVKISTTDLPKTIADLKKTWGAFFPATSSTIFSWISISMNSTKQISVLGRYLVYLPVLPYLWPV